MIRRSISMQPNTVSIAPTDLKRSASSLNDHGEATARVYGDMKAGRDNSHHSSAGLFICKANNKPLPLTSQRSIPLPAFPRFLRLSNGSYKTPKAAPDILRRTGSTSSTYSHENSDFYAESKHLSPEHTQHVDQASIMTNEN